MNAVWLLGALCLMLMGLALLMLQRGWQQVRTEQVLGRLGRERPQPTTNRPWGALERLFLQAGLSMPRERMGLVFVSWLCAPALGQLLGGWSLALLMLLAPPLLARLYLAWRYRRRVRRMVQQLPQMLDQVVRSLQTGRTLGDAMLRAIETSPDPLHGALARVQRNVQLGVALPDALDDVAELYEQEELRILAIGVRVNHLYGGSASELLGNLIKVIHERELIARQLRAMTGETRLTAVVLAVLPVAMAGYILAVNPQYLLSMWLDESGRRMLIVAFAMQLLGCLMMWRMLRSV